MKNTLKMMMFALLALGMMSCGEKKLTQEDLKKAEATLFNQDQSINEAEAPNVAEKYCKFVEQNPDDATADKWLYHALEINILLKDSDKSIALCDQLVRQYPQSKWAPTGLFLLGSYVYNDQLNDTARAHETFQKVIDNIKEFTDNLEENVLFHKKTDEEMMKENIEAIQQEEQEQAMEAQINGSQD